MSSEDGAGVCQFATQIDVVSRHEIGFIFFSGSPYLGAVLASDSAIHSDAFGFSRRLSIIFLCPESVIVDFLTNRLVRGVGASG